MTPEEEFQELLPDREEYERATASDKDIALTTLHDHRMLGLLDNGKSEDGELTWYITETGEKWVKGELSIDLKELAESNEVDTDKLYNSLHILKETEKKLQHMNVGEE